MHDTWQDGDTFGPDDLNEIVDGLISVSDRLKGVESQVSANNDGVSIGMFGDQLYFNGQTQGPHLTGPAGPPGQDGQPGRDGRSPIIEVVGDQVAIDGALTEHLTGPAGADGQPGRDGVDGKDGDPGQPGRDGVDGKDGDPGQPGRDGVDGKDGHSPVVAMVEDQVSVDGTVVGPHLTGPAGKDGRDGVDGQPGKDGVDGKPGKDGVDGKAGADGHSPAVTMIGDQVAVDGVATGPHLTGPAGKDGAPGAKGDTGTAGKDGTQFTVLSASDPDPVTPGFYLKRLS